MNIVQILAERARKGANTCASLDYAEAHAHPVSFTAKSEKWTVFYMDGEYHLYHKDHYIGYALPTLPGDMGISWNTRITIVYRKSHNLTKKHVSTKFERDMMYSVVDYLKSVQ